VPKLDLTTSQNSTLHHIEATERNSSKLHTIQPNTSLMIVLARV